MIAFAAAVVGACSAPPASDDGSSPNGKGVYVPLAWQSARGVDGHDKHVVSEKIPCAKCHALTKDELGGVTPERCTECHAKEARLEHATKEAVKRFGAGTKTDCTSCHAFTREGTGDSGSDAGAVHVPGATDCIRCHSQKQGTTPAVEIHGTSACVKCHRPHDDAKPKPGSCPECHGDIETSHAASGKAIISVCTTCHQHQHGAASEARGSCAGCHAKQKPIIPASALFEGGHTECVGCHQPHQFEKTAAVACRSCHEDQLVLGTPRVRQHNQCNSCHSPHDVKGSPEKACAKCHTDKHPDHPLKGVAGSCVGCHDPHPNTQAGVKARVRNCSTCHQTAASEKDFHGGTACRNCHVPHDFVRALADHTSCQGCHQNQLARVATLEGHQSCEGCHRGLPHRPLLGVAGQSCQSCHASEHKKANAGHQKCTGCHEPHGGKVSTACGSCHEAEHSSAPAGHRDCKSCHEPHTGSTAKKSCKSCHASEGQSAHGQMAQGCLSCHRPHGPKGVASPPSCSSCHKSATLPGLHTVDKHNDCNRCHTGHGPTPEQARTACLSCHTARKNHFPDAPRCSSCHLFTKTK